MLPLSKCLSEIRSGRTAQNASWILGGQTVSFFIQAAYFVLLARLLGATEYGVFAGAFALVSIVTPYSALGAGMLFMRYVPKNRAMAPVYWGNSLLITAATTVILAVFFAQFGPYFTHLPDRSLFAVLVVANCLLSQIAVIGGFVFQAYEKMRYTAVLTLLSNLARLIVLVFMKFVFGHSTALQWSVGMLVGTALSAAWAIFVVYKEVGAPSYDLSLAIRRSSEGIGYSFAGSTQAVYNDVDKTLLSHYGMTQQNGPYALAYRMVDFATSPIVSVDAVILPRYFRYGYENVQAVISLAKRAFRITIWMGLASAAVILLACPVVPYIVGKGFSAILPALQLLCWLPILRGAHRVTGSALTGMGFQSMRTASQVLVAVLNLLLNVWWIPVYGWIGAAWSSLASDGLLAGCNILALVGVSYGLIRRTVDAPSFAEST